MSTESIKTESARHPFLNWMWTIFEAIRRKVMARQIEEQAVQDLFGKLSNAATLRRGIPMRRRLPDACMEDG